LELMSIGEFASRSRARVTHPASRPITETSRPDRDFAVPLVDG
jgi:hypothetical protein